MKKSTFSRSLLAGALVTAAASSHASLNLALEYPINFAQSLANQGTSFDPNTNILTVTSTPRQVLPDDGLFTLPYLYDLSYNGGVEINVQLDSAGNLVGGVPGDDFVMTGRFTDLLSGVTYEGVLLTGEVIAFSATDSGGDTDQTQFSFDVTGGQLSTVPKYYPPGTDIGVSNTMERSTFIGNFLDAFTSGIAKLNIGPITPLGAGTASLGNYVWNDTNGDGIQDANEVGIDNVLVELLDTAGNVIGSTTTTTFAGKAGYYNFPNLPAGGYQVRVVESTVPAGYDVSPADVGSNDGKDSDGLSAGGVSTAPVVYLAEGEANETIDFGFYSPNTGSIGNYVFNDANNNGIQDAGETGINGATVILIDANGDIVNTFETTDNAGQAGYYNFPNLPAGDYTVVVDQSTLSEGFEASAANEGTDDTIDSDGISNGATSEATVSITTGESNDTIDFGFYNVNQAAVGNFVWFDDNHNGIQDAGEAGMNGVVVELFNESMVLVDTQVTGPNGTGGQGYYLFDNLPAGEYTIKVDLSTAQAGYEPTLIDQGANDGVDSDPFLITFTLDENQTDLSYDFGFFNTASCTGSIGNLIFNDANGNGLQDTNEQGINGVRVVLNDSAGNFVAETFTNNGAYNFGGLCLGEYSVEIDLSTVPANYTPSPIDVNGNADDDIDSDGNVVTVVLDTDSTIIDDVDVGFVPPANGSIGNFVWHDLNGNGIQDAGEPGLNNVQVILTDENGVQITLNTAVHPNSGEPGYYLFDGLEAGVYTVSYNTATLPAGFVATNSDAGADNVDSDVNGVAVTLDTNTDSDLTIDFGFYSNNSASLGNYVWDDVNQNGLQDDGETGINGVTVVVLDSLGGVVGSLVTTDDVNGNPGFYQLTGLAPGTYTVQVDSNTVPANFVPTVANNGDDANDSDSENGAAVSVTLAPGESNPTIDFGYFSTANSSIGYLVWNDANGNGLVDGDEAGIPGVTVTLTDAAGNVITTTTTDDNGAYLFDGLPAGTYMVIIDGNSLPAGVSQTYDLDGLGSENKATVTIGEGETNNDVDFGYQAQDCVACDSNVGLSSIKFGFNGADNSNVDIIDAITGEMLFWAYVDNGEMIELNAADGETLPKWIKIKVDGKFVGYINTRCSTSYPEYQAKPGLTVGDFEVLDVEREDGLAICGTTPPGECATCDSSIGTKQISITYKGYNNSTVKVYNYETGALVYSKYGVDYGDKLVISASSGILPKWLKFKVNGYTKGYLHTRCSTKYESYRAEPNRYVGRYKKLYVTEVIRGDGVKICDEEVAPSCVACDSTTGIKEITLTYKHYNGGTIRVYNYQTGELIFKAYNANNGDTIVVKTSDGSVLPKWLKFKVDGYTKGYLNTRCSSDYTSYHATPERYIGRYEAFYITKVLREDGALICKAGTDGSSGSSGSDGQPGSGSSTGGKCNTSYAKKYKKKQTYKSKQKSRYKYNKRYCK